jgi:NADH pyrophosphatase NudC (nudix superfamily)
VEKNYKEVKTFMERRTFEIESEFCEYCDPDDLVTFIAQGTLEIKVGDIGVGTIDVDTFINSDCEFELSAENAEGRQLFKSVKKITFCPMCGKKLK